MENKILLGNCLELLKTLPSESVDAIVTDPPYELGFMGKKWDASGIAYNVELWAECLRVLKSGGHLLAFSGTRTYHRMAVAIEDAGFEVRDMLEWVYASGFPKSLNVGKAVDKLQGNEREVVRKIKYGDKSKEGYNPYHATKETQATGHILPTSEPLLTKGYSPYEGFGTALKPAHEPICMARKPLSEKTIVENVLKHGTGAIDIDGCRIGMSQEDTDMLEGKSSKNPTGKKAQNVPFVEGIASRPNQQGRFPANIICTDDALNDGAMTKSGGGVRNGKQSIFGQEGDSETVREFDSNSGSKSRYFDIDVWAEKHGLLQFPKASKAERNKGCNECEGEVRFASENGSGKMMFSKLNKPHKVKGNFHPTVKPVHLMAWLIRLVSKEGDIVLDPFGGSGTTGVACNMLNRKFILMEQSEEYVEIIKSRTSKLKQLF